VAEPWQSAFQLPPDLTIWEWAEKHIEIPMRHPGRYHGRYRSGLNPYARPIFDAIQDPNIHTITIKKGSQTGITLLIHLCICYWICEDPDPVLLVMPNQSDGQSISESRLQPLIEDNEITAAEMTGDMDDFKKLQYHLQRSILNIVGANSPARLSSRPVRRLLLDECDKYPAQTGKEANAAELAIERTKTFGMFRKIIVNSTPTIATGYVNQSWGKSDQRQLFVPCHKCGEMQVLIFRQFKFDSEAPIGVAAKESCYECAECGAKWDTSQKDAAVQKVEARATTKADESGHAGFHVPSWYSPWVTIEDVVSKFLNSKDDPGSLQNWVNSWAGETWTPRPVEPMGRREMWAIRDRLDYKRGTVPTEDPCILILIADVQAQYIVWQVWAHAERDAWLVDHGSDSMLDDLDDVAAGPYQLADGTSVSCRAVFVDSGYRTSDVYDFCRARRGLAMPVKGSTGESWRAGQTYKRSVIETMPDGKPIQGGLRLIHVHPTFYKEAITRAVRPLGDDELIADQPLRLWFHNGIDDGFVDQMTAEIPIEDRENKAGDRPIIWKKIRRDNHQFDCAQYSMCIRDMMRMDLRNLGADEGDDSDDDPLPPRVTTDTDRPRKKQPKAKKAEPDDGATKCPACHEPMRQMKGGRIWQCNKCTYVVDSSVKQHCDNWDD